MDLNEIISKAKNVCAACRAEYGVHKYMPKNALGAESLKPLFGANTENLLVHLDFITGFMPCSASYILEEAINGVDDSHNPIFADGFDEAFYVEEEEEEAEESTKADDDLPV